MKIGVITYDSCHLKTEQLVLSYQANKEISEINLYALPFKKRPKRKVLFEHRPNQEQGVLSSKLVELSKVNFSVWDGKRLLDDDIDFFVIAGAGILDVGFAKGKPIVNAHPGIIPMTRGLDSFKWAIYQGDPVGITLHLIDQEVDKGEIIKIVKTPVLSTDTIETLSRRHYELEIDLMKSISSLIDERERPSQVEKKAKMRMPIETEKAMLASFEKWKKQITR
jgi:phosphoribosylglycinamide formyltransferase-1